MSDETMIEESLDDSSQEDEPKKKYKVDHVGISYYGKEFQHYMKVGEISDLVPEFKELYYRMKLEDLQTTFMEILQVFLKVVRARGRDFTPYPNQVRGWRKKWDADIMAKRGLAREIVTQKEVHQAIKTRNEQGRVIIGAPSDGELEAGMRTLGGELMNDAFQMLRDDQAMEDAYTSDELIKRRAYITNVFGHVTKMVHGKAALALKKSSETRENANFLMGLLAQATSGQMTPEQIDALETVYSRPAPQADVIVEPQDVQPV